MFIVDQCDDLDDGQGGGYEHDFDGPPDYDGTTNNDPADDHFGPALDNASTPEYHSVSRGRRLLADDVLGQLLQAR